MRSIVERETVLNKYFHEGQSYNSIAREMWIPQNTVQSMCRYYRKRNNIPPRGKAKLSEKPLKSETIRMIKPRGGETTEKRLQTLEMEVELLRNFLLLRERT